MRNILKATTGIATVAVMAFALTACSMPADNNTGNNNGNGNSSSPSADPTPVAVLASLNGVDTQVTLDQGFLDALTTLGLTPGVTGTATLTDGVLAFPITGGNVDYYDPAADYRPYVQGEIDHAGSGITLTAGDKVVGLSDFVIDPGTSRLTGTVTLNGELVGNDVFIFNLDGSTLKPLQTGPNGEAILEGTTVLISTDAAALLNDTFGTTAVTDTLVVGIAKITATSAS